MRRIIFQNMITLDGYFEGPNKEIDWHVVDEEFNHYAADLLDSVDTLLFGRVTYQLMAGYWPTPAARTDDPVIARKMNELQKIVFSKSLNEATWENTRLVRDDAVSETSRLKQQPGADMAIFGSSDLAVGLAGAGLIDDYRIFVNPLFLGAGKPLLRGLPGRLHLTLMKARQFDSGVMMLCYQPNRK